MMPSFTPPIVRISVSLKPGERLSVRPAQIGSEQGKLRLRHPLQENFLAEVVLMIAGRKHVRLDQIGQRDDMRTLVEPDISEGDIVSPPWVTST